MIVEPVAVAIGVVVHGVGTRVVVVYALSLINGDFFRFVIGDIDHFWVGGLDGDDLVLLLHHLMLVGFKITCCDGFVTEACNGRQDIGLLRQYCFPEFPCPI